MVVLWIGHSTLIMEDHFIINVFKDGKFGLYAPATGGMDMLGMFK